MKVRPAYTIVAAEAGGYVVFDAAARYFDSDGGRFAPAVMMFAGSLGDCLDYVSGAMKEAAAAPPAAR